MAIVAVNLTIVGVTLAILQLRMQGAILLEVRQLVTEAMGWYNIWLLGPHLLLAWYNANHHILLFLARAG